MALHNSYSSYKETQIKTASPVALIILLYEGMLKNIRKGEAGLQDEDRYADSASHLMKAMAIVTELIKIINPTASPELANGFLNTNRHVLGLIGDALKEKDRAPLAEAAEIILSLRSAWVEVARQSERQAG